MPRPEREKAMKRTICVVLCLVMVAAGCATTQEVRVRPAENVTESDNQVAQELEDAETAGMLLDLIAVIGGIAIGAALAAGN